MKILEEKEQEYCYKKNNDTYSKACFIYAERWAGLLEKEIDKGDKNIKEVIKQYAKKYSYDADIEGITGFMYGMAVQILSSYWEYGEELKKWHNKEYNYEGEDIINPAILIIENE